MNRSEFRERLLSRVEHAGGTVRPPALDGLETYFALLARWNAKVNLTALPLNPPRDETFDRLLVEPIVAADHIQSALARSARAPGWMDLGSGGGSPAIPLKLLRPQWKLTMVEAKERKAAFLREVVRSLSLADADVANVRFEELGAPAGSVELLTVRAVKLDASLEVAVSKLLSDRGLVAQFGSTAIEWADWVPVGSAPLASSGRLNLLRRVPRGT